MTLPYFLVGDMNVDLIEINTKSCRLLNIFRSFGLLPSINVPTRVTDTSTTYIDNIFSNVNPDSPRVVSDTSDHFGVIYRHAIPPGNSGRLMNEFSWHYVN